MPRNARRQPDDEVTTAVGEGDAPDRGSPELVSLGDDVVSVPHVFVILRCVRASRGAWRSVPPEFGACCEERSTYAGG